MRRPTNTHRPVGRASASFSVFFFSLSLPPMVSRWALLIDVALASSRLLFPHTRGQVVHVVPSRPITQRTTGWIRYLEN
jgi:hypothetical protein